MPHAQLFRLTRRMQGIRGEQQGASHVRVFCGQHASLSPAVGVTPKMERPGGKSPQYLQRPAQALAVACGGGRRGRAVRTRLAEGQVAAQHIPALVCEFVRQGTKKQHLAVAARAMGQHQAGARRFAGAMEKTAHGRLGRFVGERLGFRFGGHLRRLLSQASCARPHRRGRLCPHGYGRDGRPPTNFTPIRRPPGQRFRTPARCAPGFPGAPSSCAPADLRVHPGEPSPRSSSADRGSGARRDRERASHGYSSFPRAGESGRAGSPELPALYLRGARKQQWRKFPAWLGLVYDPEGSGFKNSPDGGRDARRTPGDGTRRGGELRSPRRGRLCPHISSYLHYLRRRGKAADLPVLRRSGRRWSGGLTTCKRMKLVEPDVCWVPATTPTTSPGATLPNCSNCRSAPCTISSEERAACGSTTGCTPQSRLRRLPTSGKGVKAKTGTRGRCLEMRRAVLPVSVNTAMARILTSCAACAMDSQMVSAIEKLARCSRRRRGGSESRR